MKTDDVNPTIAGGEESSQDQRRCDLPHQHRLARSAVPVDVGCDKDEIEQGIQTDSYQLQQQARQLAELLQQRLQDLDRREAEFHAGMARWEEECRHWRSQVQQQEEKRQQKQRRLQRLKKM